MLPVLFEIAYRCTTMQDKIIAKRQIIILAKCDGVQILGNESNKSKAIHKEIMSRLNWGMLATIMFRIFYCPSSFLKT
jgi:hypothetical protein